MALIQALFMIIHMWIISVRFPSRMILIYITSINLYFFFVVLLLIKSANMISKQTRLGSLNRQQPIISSSLTRINNATIFNHALPTDNLGRSGNNIWPNILYWPEIHSKILCNVAHYILKNEFFNS